MAEFTEGWRIHIVPSRERFGFKIVMALANTENGDFVWLLRWDGHTKPPIARITRALDANQFHGTRRYLS
jgi:hypothetical protein